MKQVLLAGFLALAVHAGLAQTPPEFFAISSLYGGSVFSFKEEGVDFGTRKVWSPNGGRPVGGLASDGTYLYGVTDAGGLYNYGTIFRVKPDGSDYQKLHDFSQFTGRTPQSGLTYSDGVFYGVTTQGGFFNRGVIYQITSSGFFAVLKSFSFLDASAIPHGKLLAASDGKLYGGLLAGGAIFSIAKDGSNFQIIHTFNAISAAPYSALIEGLDGKLYGIADNEGTDDKGIVYRISKTGQDYELLHDFDDIDGAAPYGALVQDAAGRLYGMTYRGGENGVGVIFGLDADGGNFAVLQEFGTVYGGYPFGSLSLEGDKLIGVVPGWMQPGAIFSINKDGSDFEALFESNTDYMFGLRGSLFKHSDGFYYGTTAPNTGPTYGEIYRFDIHTREKVDVFAMPLPDGNSAQGPFVQTESGMLYSTTVTGGKGGRGTIFSMDPETYEYRVLHHFTDQTGHNNQGGLTDAKNGYLFGFNSMGGAYNLGSVFRIKYDGSGFEKLYDIDGSIGAYSYAAFTLGVDGKLYIPLVAGDIWRIDADGTNLEKVFTLPDMTQRVIFGGLTLGSDGALYGIVRSDYGPGKGYLFRYDPAGTFSKIKEFNTDEYSQNFSKITKGIDGKLYVPLMTFATTAIYRIDPASPTITADKIRVFGGIIQGPFSQLPSGEYYALDGNSGYYGMGSIVKMSQDFQDIWYYTELTHTNGFVSGGFLLDLDGDTPQAISFDPLEDHVLGDPDITLTAAASSGLQVFYTSSNPEVASIYGNKIQIHRPGTTTITASQPGNSTYEQAAPVSNTLNITADTQVITFSITPSTVQYGVGTIQLNGVSSASLPVTYTSSNTAVANVSAGNLNVVGVGTTVVTAYAAGAGSFLEATPVEVTLTVQKGNQTIAPVASISKVFKDAPFTLNLNSSVGLPVSIASANNAIAEVAGNNVTIVGGGTTTLTLTQPGNNLYNAATPVSVDLHVAKADQTVSFTLPEEVVVGTQLTLQATASSGLPITFYIDEVETNLANGSVISYATGDQTKTLKAVQQGNADYNPASVTRVVKIIRKTQSINPLNVPAKVFGGPRFVVNHQASSGLLVEYIVETPGIVTVDQRAFTIIGVGTALVTAQQTGNDEYAPTSLQFSIIVDKGDPHFRINLGSTLTMGDEPFELVAESLSGGDVTFTSSNTSVATLSQGKITIVAAGQVTISARLEETSNYQGVTIQQTVEVNRGPHVVRLAAITDKILGEPAFELNATSDRNLPLTFTASNTRVQISGKSVTLVRAGKVEITASAGDDNYLPTFEKQSFCIRPKKPAITANGLNTISPTLTSDNAEGNQWYRNSVAIEGATFKTYSPKEDGVYTVRTTIDECASELSEPISMVILGVGDTAEPDIQVYPNPFDDHFSVEIGVPGETATVQLYDLPGRTIITRQLRTGTAHRIETGDLGKGVYVLRIAYGKNIITRVLVKD